MSYTCSSAWLTEHRWYLNQSETSDVRLTHGFTRMRRNRDNGKCPGLFALSILVEAMEARWVEVVCRMHHSVLQAFLS